MANTRLPGSGAGLGAIIGNALTWGFRTRENGKARGRFASRYTAAMLRGCAGILGSRAAGALYTSVMSWYLSRGSRLELTNDPRKNQLIRYFNSLDAERKKVLVRRLTYDQLIRSLKRHALATGNTTGNRFSYLTAIALSIGGRCNLDCPSCLMRPFQSPSFAAIGDLDYIFDQAGGLDVSFISIMGAGEPFLYQDYGMELLDCMKRHGDIYFFVYTNGTTVTEELIRKAVGLDNLFVLVSVEGFREGHDGRRGGGTHDKVLKTLRLLDEYRVPRGYSAVVHAGNYHEVTSRDFIESMACAGALIGCYNQSCSIFHPGTGNFTGESEARNEYYRIMDDAGDKAPIYILDLFNLEEKRYGCRAKKGTSCFIDAISGKVSPCFLFPYSSGDCNVYDRRCDSRLEDILNGGFFDHYREEPGTRRLCIRDVRGELGHLCNNPYLGEDDRLRVEALMEVIE